MKHCFKLLPIIFLLSMSSCSTGSFRLYYDSEPVNDGSLVIWCDKTKNYSTSLNGSVSFYFYLYFLNKSPSPVTVKAKKGVVYRESDNAKYSVYSNTFITGSSVKLECDIVKNALFQVYIPSHPDNDRYYFSLEYNSSKLSYYFYNTPSTF